MDLKIGKVWTISNKTELFFIYASTFAFKATLN